MPTYKRPFNVEGITFPVTITNGSRSAITYRPSALSNLVLVETVRPWHPEPDRRRDFYYTKRQDALYDCAWWIEHGFDPRPWLTVV